MTLGFRGLKEGNLERSVDDGGSKELEGFPGWRVVEGW